MSATPFRSHLLQQWARTGGNAGRAPAAIIPWLQSSEAENNLDVSGARQQQNPSPTIPYPHLNAENSIIYSSSPPSPPPPYHGHHLPSLSTVDSGTSCPPASTTRNAWNDSTQSWREERKQIARDHSSSRFFSSLASDRSRAFSEDTRVEYNDDLLEQEESPDTSDNRLDSEMVASLQSLLMSRRTATKLVSSHPPSTNQKKLDEETIHLRQALHRAVMCAQMAPNHKRTEAFSFKRFLVGSSTAQQLADIAYHVTLRKTQAEPNAEAKRKKWLQIPAFLVTLVHNNQEADNINSQSFDDSTSSSSPYHPIPYLPPTTERQLEDYAAASAAVQNALLSLHAEGIGTKWATGPVIQTRAFRDLVQAAPTDRVVALIMIGGTTAFPSDRDAKRTHHRRQRRRSIDGDFLVDLP